MRLLRRIASDLLMAASVAGLVALPFVLVGCEPWRPLTESLAAIADLLLYPE